MLRSITKRFLIRLSRGRNVLVEEVGEPLHRPGRGFVLVQEVKTGKEHTVSRDQLRKTT